MQDELGFGMYAYGWRNYDPAIARWVIPDPLLNDLDFAFDDSKVDEDDVDEVYQALITKLDTGGGIYNPDNLNPYAYGYNNPISFDDPDGRCPICPFVALAIMLLAPEPAMAPTRYRAGDPRKMTEAKEAKGAIIISTIPLVRDASALHRLSSSSKSKVAEEVSQKKGPNPNGKNGGEAHQKTINQEEAKMKKEGFSETRREVKVETPKGEKSKRYIDLEGKNPKTGEVRQVQVGKQNKNGTPVARERRAIDDIKEATGKKPEFVPYNK